MKYRNRPAIIEAIQFEDSDESVEKLIEFTDGNFEPHGDCNTYKYALIDILNGKIVAHIGDFVIKENGEIRLCDPEVFKRTYEVDE